MGSIPFSGIAALANEGGEIGAAPLNQFARAQAVGEQQQAFQQEQQQRDIQTQMMQQQLNDQKAMTAAMQQWDGKDLSQLPDLMRKNGISGSGYLQMQQAALARKQQLMTLDKDQLTNLNAHHDAALGVLKSWDGLSDSDLAQRAPSDITGLVQAGHLTPQEGQAVMQHLQTGPDQFRQWLGVYEKGLMGEKEQASQAVAQQEAAAKQATAGAEQTKAETGEWKDFPEYGISLNVKTGEQRNISTGQLVPPGMLESKYLAIKQQQAMKQPVSAVDAAFAKSYEHMKTLVPTANINLQRSLLTPQAQDMAAQLYSQTGQLPAGMRSPAMSSQILNAAAGAPSGIPNIAANKMNYAAETTLQKSATSGKMAQQVTAYNTAISHAQQLQQAADALDNGDIRALNAVGNRLGYEFGSDKTTNFNVIKNALSGEISKVFKGGEASDAEIKAVQEPFSTANSPEQLRGAITNAITLMNSKRDALKSQYEQGMQGKPNFEGGGGGGGLSVKAPNGKTYSFKDQASADAFRKAAGIQ